MNHGLETWILSSRVNSISLVCKVQSRDNALTQEDEILISKSLLVCTAGVPVRGEQKAAAGEGEGLKNVEGEGEGSEGNACPQGLLFCETPFVDERGF